jgi:uroporphyrinogen decarboxylase
MKPRDRVHAALRREPVDRVPIFMWFHPDTAQRLADLLEIPPRRVAEALGDDVRQTWVGNNHAMEGIVHDSEGETHLDDWGVDWVRLGQFNQIRRYPLQHATPEEIRSYSFPHARIPDLLRTMEQILPLRHRFFIGCDISPCLFEMSCRLCGMERAIIDVAADPVSAAALLDHACEFSLELARRACASMPLDWLWTGDDVGGQQALIMSPTSWRELVRPRLERIFAVGRQHHLWVAYHSCGVVTPIIPDLIDMGLDVLNPVQCNCPGMDPLDLKREYGSQLAFMGGVDTQELLPHADAPTVRRATERLLETMTADGGGYILAASHTVPPETPTENIFALYAAAGVSQEQIRDNAADMRAAAATGVDPGNGDPEETAQP